MNVTSGGRAVRPGASFWTNARLSAGWSAGTLSKCPALSGRRHPRSSGRQAMPPAGLRRGGVRHQGIRLAAEQPCGKRLHTVPRDWLSHWEQAHGSLGTTHRGLLRRVIPACAPREPAPPPPPQKIPPGVTNFESPPRLPGPLRCHFNLSHRSHLTFSKRFSRNCSSWSGSPNDLKSATNSPRSVQPAGISSCRAGSGRCLL